jgi:hypothetical protein
MVVFVVFDYLYILLFYNYYCFIIRFRAEPNRV